MDSKPTRDELIKARLKKRIKAEDIKHPGRLTDYEVGGIDLKNVYEWVKTGQWSKTDFERWCKALRII